MASGSFLAAYGTRSDAELSVQIRSDQLVLDRIDFSGDYVATDEHTAPIPQSQKRTTSTVGQGPGTLTIRQVLPNLTFVVRSDEPSEISPGNVSLFGPRQDVFLSSATGKVNTLEPFTDPFDWPNDYDLVAPGPTNHLRADRLSFNHTGTFLVLLSGADVEIQNATGTHAVRAGSWTESSPDDPTGLSTMYFRYHQTVLVGKLVGKIQVTYRGPFGNVVFPTGTLDGVRKLSAPLADAAFRIGDVRYDYHNESHMEVEGLFAATFPPPVETKDGAGVAITIAGDVSRISEDRILVHEFDAPDAILVTTAAGLGLVVLAWVAISFVRRGAAYVGAQFVFIKWLTFLPLSARVEPETVLDHEVRRGVLSLLELHGSLYPLNEFKRAASDQFGIAPVTVYYHLRRLHRARRVAFYQGASRGSLWVRAEEKRGATPELDAVLVWLREPVPAAIAGILVETREVAQDELVRRTRQGLERPPQEGGIGRTLTRQAVTKWIRKFEAFHVPATASAGPQLDDLPPDNASGIRNRTVVLVESRRDGRHVRYKPAAQLIEAWKRRTGPTSGALPEGVHRLSPSFVDTESEETSPRPIDGVVASGQAGRPAPWVSSMQRP